MKYILNQKGNIIMGYNELQVRNMKIAGNSSTELYEELWEKGLRPEKPEDAEYVNGFEIVADDEVVGKFRENDKCGEAEMEDLLRDIINDKIKQIPIQKQLEGMYSKGE